MPGSQLNVHLYRDSFTTPWGFRLQGGKDLGQALSIQRVFSNSPAEGELQRGDVILSISKISSDELTHKQALDLIKHGGGSIQLVIQRPFHAQATSSVSIKPQRPRAPSLQVDLIKANETPATEGFVRYHMERLRRLKEGGGLKGPDVPENVFNPTGEPPKVVNLRQLGGGGYVGADYATLPRRSQRQSSQPPTPTSYGFQPRKVTLSGPGGLGGGGPNFGTDFTSTAPRSPVTHVAAPMAATDMLSKQPQVSPGGYISTGQRLDMEREAEEERKRQLHYQQQLVAQQQQAAMQAQQQQYLQQAPAPQLVPQQAPVDYVPVPQPTFPDPAYVPTASVKQPAPRVPKPLGGNSGFNFGVDYSRPAQPPPIMAGAVDGSDAPPAWRNSLKQTGIKAWDIDVDYQYGQSTGPRSSPFNPANDPSLAAKAKEMLAAPAPAPVAPASPTGDGPQVVHLQYNSPMGLYSQQNVQDTYQGQTRALTGQPAPAPAPMPVSTPAPKGKEGDRDWQQSDLLRLIHEEEGRKRGLSPQPRGPPPQTAPKPMAMAAPAPAPMLHSPGGAFIPTQDDFGTSDF